MLKEKRQPHSIFNTLLFIDNYTKSFIKDAKVKRNGFHVIVLAQGQLRDGLAGGFVKIAWVTPKSEHCQHLSTELRCNSDSLMRGRHTQHRGGGHHRLCTEREKLQRKIWTCHALKGTKIRNTANKKSDLSTKHEKVFHYHCIIITQASGHLLMWQLIFIINVFWQVFKRPLTGASLTYRGLGKKGLLIVHPQTGTWEASWSNCSFLDL